MTPRAQVRCAAAACWLVGGLAAAGAAAVTLAPPPSPSLAEVTGAEPVLVSATTPAPFPSPPEAAVAAPPRPPAPIRVRPAAEPVAPPRALRGAARVAVADGAPAGLRLRDADGGEHAPGEVPPGVYTLWAPFGGRITAWGEVTVRPGELVMVSCRTTRPRCRAIHPGPAGG